MARHTHTHTHTFRLLRLHNDAPITSKRASLTQTCNFHTRAESDYRKGSYCRLYYETSRRGASFFFYFLLILNLINIFASPTAYVYIASYILKTGGSDVSTANDMYVL